MTRPSSRLPPGHVASVSASATDVLRRLDRAGDDGEPSIRWCASRASPPSGRSVTTAASTRSSRRRPTGRRSADGPCSLWRRSSTRHIPGPSEIDAALRRALDRPRLAGPPSRRRPPPPRLTLSRAGASCRLGRPLELRACTDRRWCRGRRSPRRWYSRLAASRFGPRREVDLLGATIGGLPSRAARLSASPTPWPRAPSSTTTSSIHALKPVGSGYIANVRLPTISPSTRATNSAQLRVADDRLQAVAPGRWRRARQLGDQPVEGGDEIVADLRDDLDVGTHSAARLTPGVG